MLQVEWSYLEAAKYSNIGWVCTEGEVTILKDLEQPICRVVAASNSSRCCPGKMHLRVAERYNLILEGSRARGFKAIRCHELHIV